MGTIYTLKYLDKTYVIDDNFGLDKQVGELFILDSISKTNTVEEALEYMCSEYKFSILEDYTYCEVSGGATRLEIYMEDKKSPYIKTLEKRDVISFLEEFKGNNNYKSFDLECDDYGEVYAIMKR